MRARIVSIILVALALLTAAEEAAAQCSTAWAPNVFYATNTVVSFNSRNYRCLQSHTSQVGWEPPNVASLWADQGACSGTPTPTSGGTATATSTARASATPTSTPTATSTGARPTPTSGSVVPLFGSGT